MPVRTYVSFTFSHESLSPDCNFSVIFDNLPERKKKKKKMFRMKINIRSFTNFKRKKSFVFHKSSKSLLFLRRSWILKRNFCGDLKLQFIGRHVVYNKQSKFLPFETCTLFDSKENAVFSFGPSRPFFLALLCLPTNKLHISPACALSPQLKHTLLGRNVRETRVGRGKSEEE